jgi:CheY-like chemotaxis protein
MNRFSEVLLVEDDYAALYLMQLQLHDLALASRISTALNGQQALDYLTTLKDSGKQYPEVIFLDINMPIMDGFEFLQACKDHHMLQGQATKVIVVTSSDHQDDVLRAREYQITAFLTKPVTEESILSALEASPN